jgi:hypothetical protein
MSNPKTPVGRISFPNLLKPKLNDMNPAAPKMEYSVDLLFDKNTDISAIQEVINQAIGNKWGAKPPKGLRSPIKDGDGVKPMTGEPYGPEYHGHYFITLKNTRKPGVVDASNQPIIGEEEIYGGCFGRASFNAFAYEKGGNKGVSLSLINFQKVKDGEAFGSSRVDAESDFDVVDEEADNEANYVAPAKKKSILG